MLYHVVCQVTERQTGARGRGVSNQQIHDTLRQQVTRKSSNASQCPTSSLNTGVPAAGLCDVARKKRGFSRSWNISLSHCYPHPVHVSFTDVGWSEWIIQPRVIETAFCIGRCPGRRRYPRRIQSRCCVASEKKSLHVVHYDVDGSLNVTTLPDFVVTACRCRRCRVQSS